MARRSLQFSVDSQLLGELGERLVTKKYIALAELVKNAYDADATEITIRITDAKSGGPESEIALIDNGSGMDYAKVKRDWMRVATTDKLEHPFSDIYGRKKTGNKGIGRFACRRLAYGLTLTTVGRVKGKGERQRTQAVFDWTRFLPGTDLTEITCVAKTDTTRASPGLTLRLIGLTEPWTDNDFRLPWRQVLTLSVAKGERRPGYKEDPGFEIKVEAPEFEWGEGRLADHFMNAGWGTLYGSFSRRGIASLRMEAKLLGKRRFEIPGRFSRLSGASFEIAWVPIEKDYFRNPRTLTLGLAKKITREQGGVRVYMDGFRVYPYGGPGDDWLEIDRDVARRVGSAHAMFIDLLRGLGLSPTRAMLNHPRHSNLIGKVHLRSDQQPGLVMKMDREGFIDGAAFRELKRFLRLSLQWFTAQYGVFLQQFSEERFAETVEAVQAKAEPPVSAALTMLESHAKQHRGEESGRHLKDATAVLRHSLDVAESETAMLRTVASTGPLVFAFAHEVVGVMSRLEMNANELESLKKVLPRETRREIAVAVKSLRQTRDRFDEQAKLFKVFSSGTKRPDKGHHYVRKAAEEVAKGFAFVKAEYGIMISCSGIPGNLKTGLMMKAELYSLLVNLTSNAIKATIAARGKKIRIEARPAKRRIVLTVLDTGTGLAPGHWEEVFKPMVVDPEGRMYPRLAAAVSDDRVAVLGRGTGLGLSIVRSIVESYDGRARFVKARTPWKACVEVSLP